MSFLKIFLTCFSLSFPIASIVLGGNSIGIASNTASILTSGKNSNNQEIISIDEYNKHIRKIFRRNEIEDEARRLFKKGFYDEAIQKYREAIQPSLLNNDHEQCYARGKILDIYRHQGKFELALEELQWFFKRNPTKEEYIEKKLLLGALLEAKNTHSSRPIADHIGFLRMQHKNELPPRMYGPRATLYTGRIIYLYDYIGDTNGGIAFVNGVLSYFSKRKNVEKIKAEYLKVKQAFEEDKKQGTKGRATQALIQSDYFPW